MKLDGWRSVIGIVLIAVVSGCSDPAKQVYQSNAAEPDSDALVSPVSGTAFIVRADSTIQFIGSKVTGSHEGGFRNFAGVIPVADGAITGSPVIKINMKSVWSDNERLTGHLKSADFFEVEKFPVSTFTVTKIESDSQQQLVTGNLDLHGVTKSISFPARIEISSEQVTVNADFAINRKDFNINYLGKQDDLIRDNVVLKLALRATPGEARPEDQLNP